jgi:hypothetical protein
MGSIANNAKLKWVWGALGIIVLALVVLAVVSAASGKLWAKHALKSEYQAVFLTNGQVYFGKMEFRHGWVTLRDIYYLQRADGLQQAAAGDGNSNASAPAAGEQQQQLQLVKLGSEVHGPEDEMHIARDKIMFWENLKSDSRVVQKIKGN